MRLGIYTCTLFKVQHHNSLFSAFPPFSGLEAAQTTAEKLTSFQTAMIHPYSLMERDSHPESIYELLGVKVDRALIATIVEETAETINQGLSSTAASRGRSSSRTLKTKEFTKFVERVLDAAEVDITDILVALVYMRRAKAHLSIDTEQWALHRIFLGALILAHKYCNDSTLKNKSWSYSTGIFGMRDIGRMEREFLDVLDYELSFSEADLLDLHETLVPPRSPQPPVQLHPFFHSSGPVHTPRPQSGVQMSQTRRVIDKEEHEDGPVSSTSFYKTKTPATPVLGEINSSDEEPKVGTGSSDSSPEIPTSSESSSESTAATSVFSYHPHEPKPVHSENDAQRSVISRALSLARHQLISSIPKAFALST
ncbi:hypothetical protein BDM02DRAFT_3123462 [Thelephora ganbajun]|uniref:Uncharacterized protein n=1 Tax=Thelephora ganbajun TaxID=370292 RepID=A0ACB6Z147_THEGA|nr:hypothetical protein BDM02DRAFT_3123462 [Thelephora ganbajun]